MRSTLGVAPFSHRKRCDPHKSEFLGESEPVNSIFAIIAVLIALTGAALTVHLVLSWMERRGWVYYRTKDRPRPSSLGLVAEIFQPSIEHVTEETAGEQSRADQAESGETEDPETPSDP
jgi:hypothetical protein